MTLFPIPTAATGFTDPPYGGQLYEGAPDAPGGATNPHGKIKQRVGQAAEIGGLKRELPTNCYRVDPSGKVESALGFPPPGTRGMVEFSIRLSTFSPRCGAHIATVRDRIRVCPRPGSNTMP